MVNPVSLWRAAVARWSVSSEVPRMNYRTGPALIQIDDKMFGFAYRHRLLDARAILHHRPLDVMNGDGSSHQAVRRRRGPVLQDLEGRREPHRLRSVWHDGVRLLHRREGHS